MRGSRSVGSARRTVGSETRALRRGGLVLLIVLLAGSLAMPASSHAATTSPSAWFKPGNPFTWQFPDPSVHDAVEAAAVDVVIAAARTLA